ncbi:hypothetical protein HNP33_000427 [Comamonas odontotermitis]|uniref:Uncharacterized protein n=1 Tax=Comamonas odontotermitis TaxID=379895 RepID=A0ABR6RB46_9BURK|nr:hypothetical protein [Comamonas odontotermitis]MBB6576379.1 hypothetical protein [Comamonas odontotermitis]
MAAIVALQQGSAHRITAGKCAAAYGTVLWRGDEGKNKKAPVGALEGASLFVMLYQNI